MLLRPAIPSRLAVWLAVALAGGSVARGAEKPAARTLLDAAATYLTGFVQRFSNVVAEELYTQQWTTNTGVTMARRELRSDFLLTRPTPTSGWLAFRDVYEVDGAAVRDHGDRLVDLFLKASPRAAEEIAAIALESARYNLGNVARTINQPFFTLIFLQRSYQARLTFSVDKIDKAIGPEVWIVQFKEQARPTFVRGSSGKDLPARGRFWINATTGEILKTEILLEDNVQKTEITTTFRMDERFQIALPIEMKEQYALKGNRGRISGIATYQRFRQFEIQTQEAPK